MQIDGSFLGGAFVCAAIIVGVMEWAKHGWKTAPALVWWAALPPLAVAAAIVFGGTWHEVGIRAGLIWILGQFGYDIIVKGVIDLIKNLAEKFAQGLGK